MHPKSLFTGSLIIWFISSSLLLSDLLTYHTIPFYVVGILFLMLSLYLSFAIINKTRLKDDEERNSL